MAQDQAILEGGTLDLGAVKREVSAAGAGNREGSGAGLAVVTEDGQEYSGEVDNTGHNAVFFAGSLGLVGDELAVVRFRADGRSSELGTATKVEVRA